MNTHTVVNPYSRRAIGRLTLHTEKEGLALLKNAVKVWDTLKSLSRYQKSEALKSISQGLSSQREVFARVLMKEAGKPIVLARKEVERAIFTFAYAAEEINRYGVQALPMDLIPGAERRQGVIERFPVGPILGITPFNFPLNLVAHKVAPALATGNPIIIKPNIQTPYMALKLMELVDKSGFPKHSMQVALLPGAEAESIATHSNCAMVSFTGSAKIGWHLKRVAAHKRVALELGGNAVAVLAEDGDPEPFAKKVVSAAFGYAGQSCISVQTAMIHKRHYSSVKQAIVQLTKAVKVGNPAVTETWCGPVINKEAADRLQTWIQLAQDDGGRLLVGGKRTGLVLSPCVLENVPEHSSISCEEAFGPVLLLKRFGSDEESTAFINRSRYGLQSGVFTRDYARMRYYFETLHVGGVLINEVPTYRIDHMPYGGVKDSGFGREGLIWAMEEMTEPRLLMINP